MHISNTFLDSPVIQDLETSFTTKAGMGAVRVVLFLRILAHCVDGRVFIDVKHAETILQTKVKSLQDVWSFCVARNILVPVAGGFSAKEWCVTQGIFDDPNFCAENALGRAEKSGPVDYTPPPQKTPQGASSCKETAFPSASANPAFVNVRSNVRLTAAELSEINAKYGEIKEQIFDKLSDWKASRNYGPMNDFQQIEKWTAKAVMEIQAKQKKDSETWAAMDDQDFVNLITPKEKR